MKNLTFKDYPKSKAKELQILKKQLKRIVSSYRDINFMMVLESMGMEVSYMMVGKKL